MPILFKLTKTIINDVTRTAVDKIRTRRNLGSRSEAQASPIHSKCISRSKTVVHNFLRDPSKYEMKKRTGLPCKISFWMRQNIRLTIKQGKHTAKKVKAAVDLDHVSTDKSLLTKSKEVSWVKLMSTPRLTKLHTKQRILWAQIHICYSLEQWIEVVFSNEKRFNQDGSDCCRFYCDDLRSERKVLRRRHTGGESVWSGLPSHTLNSQF